MEAIILYGLVVCFFGFIICLCRDEYCRCGYNTKCREVAVGKYCEHHTCVVPVCLARKISEDAFFCYNHVCKEGCDARSFCSGKIHDKY